MKAISILGSTGSIGTNALRVTSSFPKQFRVAGLSAGRNTALLADQIEKIRPEIASSADKEASAEVRAFAPTRLPHGAHPVRTRARGHIEVACHPESDMVLSAISGAAGLLPPTTPSRTARG